MKTITKFTRKVLSQIITVYQWTLDIELPDIWLKLLIKPNKDVDDMLDVVNAKLIDVCWEYLEWKKLWLDKYQLATICAQLTTLAMEQCEEPFRVSVKTSKQLVQDYLEKNTKKREALERIKQENLQLDKELALKQDEIKTKKRKIAEPVIEEYDEPQPKQKATPKPKTKKGAYRKWAEDMLIDNSFTLPI